EHHNRRSLRHILKFFHHYKSPAARTTKPFATTALPITTTTPTTTASPKTTCIRKAFCQNDYKWDQSECKCISKTTSSPTTSITASPQQTCPVIDCPNNYYVDPSDCKCTPQIKLSTDSLSSRTARRVTYRPITRPSRAGNPVYPKYAANPSE
ncbi:17877_t:CDS:1, partial [Racocetra fulgida]